MSKRFEKFYIDNIIQFDKNCLNPEPLPTFLQIELTDRCNLKCKGCPRSYTISQGSTFSIEDFKKILRDLPSLNHISFVGAGEALLVRDFPAYLQLCSIKSIFTSCNSNGILIESRLPAAVEAGLDKISISIDACDPSLLAKLRSEISLEKVTKAFLLALSIADNSKTNVSAAITLGEDNLFNFSSLLNYLADIGVKNVTVESFHHWGDDKTMNKKSLFNMPPQKTIASIEEGLEIALSRDLNLSIFDYRRLNKKEEYKDAVCQWPFDAMFVTSMGDVTPCCVNIQSTESNLMGNLKKDNISDIWMNKRYKDLRISFKNKKPWSVCEDCVYLMEFGGLTC